MNDKDMSLRRAEQQLGQLESNLLTATTTLLAREGELLQRLARLREAAAQAGDSALQGRLKAFLYPKGELEAQWDAAFRARDEALRVRANAAERLKQVITTHHAQVQKLGQLLQQEEASLQRVPRKPAPVAAPPTKGPVAPAASPAALGRKQARVTMQTSVDLESESNFFTGFSSNISDGGIFIATSQLMALGTEIDLSFTLPTGEKIRVPGVVKWVRQVNDETPDVLPGLGIQFKKMNPQVEAAIKRFVSSRDPLFFPG